MKKSVKSIADVLVSECKDIPLEPFYSVYYVVNDNWMHVKTFSNERDAIIFVYEHKDSDILEIKPMMLLNKKAA